MALALDNGADNTDSLDLIDKYFYRKPIPKDKLDINPDTLFEPDEQTLIHALAPAVDKTVKCVLTALVRKSDRNYDKYNTGDAKEYIMEVVPSVSLMKVKYLMPMVSYDLQGYYEVTDMIFNPKSGSMKFKLGKFIPLGEKLVNIAGKMRHGELINIEYVERLYNEN